MVKCLVKIRTKVNVHLRMVNHCYRDVRVRVLSLGPRILRRAMGGIPFLPALIYGPPSEDSGGPPDANGPGVGSHGASGFRETPELHEGLDDFENDFDYEDDDADDDRDFRGARRDRLEGDEEVLMVGRRGDVAAWDEAGVTGRSGPGEGGPRAPVHRWCPERVARGSEEGAAVVPGPSRREPAPPRVSGSHSRPDDARDPHRPLPPFPTNTPARAPGSRNDPNGGTSSGGGSGSKRGSLSHHPLDAAPPITNGGSADGGAATVSSVAPRAPRRGVDDAAKGGGVAGGAAAGAVVGSASGARSESEGAAAVEDERACGVDAAGAPWARVAVSVLRVVAAASLLAAANLLLLVLLLESPAELEPLRWMRESPLFLHFHYGCYCPARRWLACTAVRVMGGDSHGDA